MEEYTNYAKNINNKKRGIVMFLENLSVSILQICETEKISYEKASERCNLSSRYFGDIIRKQSTPSILSLEKICTGFELTPNDLLIPSPVQQELSYRKPMKVNTMIGYQNSKGITYYPICPRCDISFEHDFQNFCSHCGQNLSWENFPHDTIILNSKETISK